MKRCPAPHRLPYLQIAKLDRQSRPTFVFLCMLFRNVYLLTFLRLITFWYRRSCLQKKKATTTTTTLTTQALSSMYAIFARGHEKNRQDLNINKRFLRVARAHLLFHCRPI